MVKLKLQRLNNTAHLRQDPIIDERIRRIQQDPHVSQVRQDLLKQLEPLCSEFRSEDRQSSYVPAWLRESGHDTRSQRIADYRQDDRDGGGCFGSQSSRRPMGDDHIHIETSQVRNKRRKLIVVAVRPAVLDDKIPSFLIAEIAQAQAKGFRTFGQTVSRRQTQESDPKDLRRWLLRTRLERPRNRRTAKKCDELAPLHVPSARTTRCP